MDYIQFYQTVKSGLEDFLRKYLDLREFQDPENVAVYKDGEIYQIKGKITNEDVEMLLEEDDEGVYSFGDLIIRDNSDKNNLEKTLAHELLHHVGRYFKLERLSDEYYTELLTNAYMKWKYGDVEENEDEDVIKIYLDNPYGLADEAAKNKSVDEIVNIFKKEDQTKDDIILIEI